MIIFAKKSQKVKRPRKEIDIEEIFLDKLAKKREQESDIASIKLEVPLSKASFFLLMGAVIFVLLAFSAFAFYFQVFKQQFYALLAQRNSSIIARFAAERGIIYDRNMNQLVKNEATFDLYLNIAELPENQNPLEAVAEISALLGWKTSEKTTDWQEFFSTSSQSETLGGKIVLIKQGLSQMDLVLLETKKAQMPFWEVKKHIVRHYVPNACFGHILGYLGKISQQEFESLAQEYDFSDYIGRQGVEKSYEYILKEQKGAVQIERDAKGNELSRKIISQPASGSHLVLSLDLALQEKALQVLNQTLLDSGASKGVVIALDPQNGEVLAMVSLPCFDNNLFGRGISVQEIKKLNEDKTNPQLNRAIAGLYPTGSSIKPFIATAGLEEKIISPSTTLFCPLKICIEHPFQKGEADCYVDNKYHGWTDVKRALAESVNPFFYIIGGGYTAPKSSSEFFNPDLPRRFAGLGIARIKKYLELFGFNKQTGIDLPSEAEGRVPDPAWKEKYFETPLTQKWYLGDTYNLSIGQGYFLATPLQVAAGYSAIANGGKLITPHLAKSFLTATSSQTVEFQFPLVRENFISTSSLDIVKQGMRQAVALPSGSAFSLSGLPVAAAAKTGTAQAYGAREIYNNWIGVFAPYENPEIVLVVMLEEVPGLQGAAQKTARNILSWYFSSHKTELSSLSELNSALPEGFPTASELRDD